MRKASGIFAIIIIIFSAFVTAKNLGMFPTDFSDVDLSYSQSDSQRFYYNRLSENGKIAYTLILPELAEHTERIEIPKLTEDELDSLMYAISYDNPDMICYGRSCEMTMDHGKYYFIPFYAHDKSQCQSCKEQFNQALNKALGAIPKNGSEFEKELAIHDYICNNSRYVLDDYENLKVSAYDLLVNGEAVCEGYARTAQLLLNLSGIANYIVIGESDMTDSGRTGHMWNVVTIGGENYYLDVTWDDIDEQTEGVDGCYLYFNVPEEVIRRDHFEIEPDDNGCNSYKYNYYNVNNSLYTSYDNTQRTRLENAVIKNLRGGKSICEMYFTDEQTFNKAYSELIDNSVILDILSSANKRSSAKFKEVEYMKYQNAYYIRFVFS
ncbi:MAG: hypothetical protein IJK26_08445 [Clostridia bacterium]|nr:hypothetical protein [Clostridia bacterium]